MQCDTDGCIGSRVFKADTINAPGNVEVRFHCSKMVVVVLWLSSKRELSSAFKRSPNQGCSRVVVEDSPEKGRRGEMEIFMMSSFLSRTLIMCIEISITADKRV